MSSNLSEIKTEPYTAGLKYFLRRAASQWIGGSWWWLFAFPAILAIASPWLPILLFIALMLVFLLYPGVTMIVYFHCMLSPYARDCVYRQSVIFSSRGLERRFYPDDNYATVSENQEFATKDIQRIELHNKYLLFIIKGGKYNYIIVPAEELNDEDISAAETISHECGIDFAYR